jgi:hypothetical protein
MKRFWLAIGLLALAGCNSPTQLAGGVELSISVERAEFRAGQTNLVTVTARNGGDRAVKIYGNNCPPVYVVIDANENIVGPRALGALCTLALKVVTLEPGGTYDFRHNWPGDGAGRRDASAGLLTPGAYKLRAIVTGENVWAETPLLPVRIIP